MFCLLSVMTYGFIYYICGVSVRNCQHNCIKSNYFQESDMTEEGKISRDLTEEEFGRIFSRCRQMFVKIANSYIHDDSAAEDIVNECFIRMWEKRATLNTENYESYAFKSIINRCLDYLKVENNRTRIHKNFYETGSRMRTYEINSLNSLDPEHLFAHWWTTVSSACRM